MRKILYVNLFPEIGGAETSLIYLLEKLDRKRFTPIVLLPEPGYFSQRLAKSKVKVLFLKLPGYLVQYLFIPGIDPIAQWKFINLCRVIKPDIIHLNHITQSFYAGLVRKMYGIPVVAHSHVTADSIYIYQDLLYRFCIDTILAVSTAQKQRLLSKRIIPPEKIKIMHPGIDTRFFIPTVNKKIAKVLLKIPENKLVITIASRFDPTKDHLTFLKAMLLVIKTFPNITICIAQDRNINLDKGNQLVYQVRKEIMHFLKMHPELETKIMFTGYLANMVQLYQATDVLVSSSLYESVGLIHLEAAASGLPIVSTNFGSQKEVVIENKNGFLVPIRNPEKMAEKIVVLLKNAHLRKFFGANGRKHVSAHFSLENYVQNMESLYDSVTKRDFYAL